MIKKWIFIAALLCPTAIFAQISSKDWIDLTHPFDSDTVYWPTSEPFSLQVVYDGMTTEGYYYRANQYQAAEHGGTHIDAPSHFAKNGRTVGQIPLSQLMGNAVIIDVRQQALPDDDYLITIGDIKAWEKLYGDIPNNSIVLFYTGYSDFWPDRFRYLGTVLKGQDAVAGLHFPGLAKDTAEWLISHRNIKAVGIDTASIDYGQTLRYPTHQTLSAHNIPIFENVANLNKIQSPFAEVIALPMDIKNGTGAPLRMIAKPIPYEPPETTDETTTSNQ